ncbi:hypothetical protein NO343_01105 [Mycoplasma capricolum subsp. capricolum]|nr:hypothetical protein [Mycoplasma capricolum]WBX36697.1 hypothetical protein NO343_01105 [Mycoplasma capricolum subsp. capricolum]
MFSHAKKFNQDISK